MKVEFDNVSDREMNRAIQRLADEAGTAAKETLVSQARLFCADLAYNTRPVGKSAAQGREMKQRIKERVEFIYIPVGAAVNMLKRVDEKVARIFQKALRKRNHAQATALMIRHFGGTGWEVGPFDGGQLHEQQRFKARVQRRMVVTEKGALTTYKKKEMAQAGFAKGGYATAARQLGGVRGIPGFATRHNAPGTGRVSGDKKNLTVVIENRVRHAHHALSQSGEDRALRHRVKAITKNIKRMADYRFKKQSKALK
jgi:hypothetical protein